MRPLALCLALGLSGAAVADEVSSSTSQKAPVVLAAIKAGGLFPQVLNPMSTSYTLAAEVGWITPLLNSQLALSVEVDYDGPSRTNSSVSDPRLPSGGSYTYTITEKTLGVYVGPKYFILPTSRDFVPWLSLGVRVQFIDSHIVANASGADFGTEDETGTHLAYGGQLGAGYHLGPGFLALEVQFISSPIDHFVTGKANVGDLDVRLGYVVAF